MPRFAAPLQQGFPGPADKAQEVSLEKHLKETRRCWGRRVLNNLKERGGKKSSMGCASVALAKCVSWFSGGRGGCVGLPPLWRLSLVPVSFPQPVAGRGSGP